MSCQKRCRENVVSCQDDVTSRRGLVKLVSCQHGIVSIRHRARTTPHHEHCVVSTWCRVNTASCQYGVASKRICVNTKSYQDNIMSGRRRANAMSFETMSCQLDVVPRRRRVNMAPCRVGVVPTRHSAKTTSTQKRCRVNTTLCQDAPCQDGAM